MENISLNKHINFILSPITTILKDVVSASSGVGSGIEAYPLCDYVMQSVFLKMTGAQEQKIKIITWELASHDYEYRYLRFTQKRLGECSNYNDKKEVYKDLIQQIKKHNSNFDISSFIDRSEILSKTKLSIENIFSDTNLLIWAQKSFNEYQSIWSDIKHNYFVNDEKTLFGTIKDKVSLKNIYEDNLYKHRNKVAHNTLSYQQNLPTLKTLNNSNFKYENYFVYFSILILIDTIFIELFNEYIQIIEDN